MLCVLLVPSPWGVSSSPYFFSLLPLVHQKLPGVQCVKYMCSSEQDFSLLEALAIAGRVTGSHRKLRSFGNHLFQRSWTTSMAYLMSLLWPVTFSSHKHLSGYLKIWWNFCWTWFCTKHGTQTFSVSCYITHLKHTWFVGPGSLWLGIRKGILPGLEQCAVLERSLHWGIWAVKVTGFFDAVHLKALYQSI